MDALGISPRVNLKLILEGEEEIGRSVGVFEGS